MLLTSRVGPDGEPPSSGIYYDEWRRTSEGWRFASPHPASRLPGDVLRPHASSATPARRRAIA